MIDKIKGPRCSPVLFGVLIAVGFALCEPGIALAQVSGSGTINKLPKWSPTTTSLSDSVIFDNGNVGIGLTDPVSRLEVAGDIRGRAATPAFYLYDTSGAANARQFYFWNTGGLIVGRWVNDANTLVVAESITFKNNGNIGVGTTAPGAKLHLSGPSASFGSGLKMTSTDSGGKTFAFYPLGNTLVIRDDTAGVARVTIDTNGKVGIGTATPSNALDVVGNINATGNITATGNIAAKYQDIAEWVPARNSISVATVVVLDSEKSNHVLASSQAYDTRVAGVISERPGVILGEAGAGKVLVATTGRVRVKVDATAAPIRVGDLLVTSNKQGIAMRSLPLDLGGTPIHRPGTLIGKALEPLDKGLGEILVLLSLQ